MEFLTEARLKVLTENVFQNTTIKYNKKLLTFRPDVLILEANLVIEFDGPRHFTTAKVVLRDRLLDYELRRVGIKAVHVPYFIQIDASTFPLIFGKAPSSNTLSILSDYKYPHGFIDSKATLPADYCSLGVEQFLKTLDFYSEVKSQVILSLDALLNRKKCMEEVYPLNLYAQLH